MNSFALSSIFTFFSSSLMAAFIFFKNRGKKSAVVWGWFCVLVIIWGASLYIAATTQSKEIAFLAWQFANITTIYAAVVHHHFVLTYIGLKKPIQLKILYTLATTLLCFNFLKPELYIGDVSFLFDQFYYVDWTIRKNFLYIATYVGFYWILLTYSFLLLVLHYKTLPRHRRNQMKYLIYGSILASLGAHGDYLPAFGYKIYPHTNYCLALFSLVIGYAIIRHQLMDISIAIKKSLVYSISLTFITAIFVSFVLIFERLFQNILGYHSIFSSILAALAIVFIFNPIKDRIQYLVDRLFFKGTASELAEQNQMLRLEVAKKEKFKAVATLASGVAHEVKNPLTALKAFFEYFPQKKNDPEFMEKFTRIANKEFGRIEQLVKQLLDFAKPSAPEFKKIDIHQLLDDTIDLNINTINTKNITIKKQYSQQDTQILIDPNQIKQAVLNIIQNAIEAMGEGGTLTVGVRVQGLGDRKKPKSIKPNSLHPTPHTLTPKISITIKDTGPGIAKEDIKNIFDPFFSKKETGTGLGLAITQSIMEGHKGKISIKSQVGVGTTFCMTLPINAEDYS